MQQSFNSNILYSFFGQFLFVSVYPYIFVSIISQDFNTHKIYYLFIDYRISLIKMHPW